MEATGVIFRPILGFVLAELVINCIIAGLTLIVVCLRILGRRLGPGLGWDDFLIIIVTVCHTPQTSLSSPNISLTVSQPMSLAMVIAQGIREWTCYPAPILGGIKRLTGHLKIVAPIGSGYDMAENPERE